MKTIKPWAWLKISLYNLNDKRAIFKIITIFYLFLFLWYWPVQANINLNKQKEEKTNIIVTICLDSNCSTNKSLVKVNKNFSWLNVNKNNSSLKNFIKEQKNKIKEIDRLIDIYKENHELIVDNYKYSLENLSKEEQHFYLQELQKSSSTINDLDLYKEDLIAYKNLKTQAELNNQVKKMRIQI